MSDTVEEVVPGTATMQEAVPEAGITTDDATPAAPETLLDHVRQRILNVANDFGIEFEHVRDFFISHI